MQCLCFDSCHEKFIRGFSHQTTWDAAYPCVALTNCYCHYAFNLAKHWDLLMNLDLCCEPPDVFMIVLAIVTITSFSKMTTQLAWLFRWLIGRGNTYLCRGWVAGSLVVHNTALPSRQSNMGWFWFTCMQSMYRICSTFSFPICVFVGMRARVSGLFRQIRVVLIPVTEDCKRRNHDMGVESAHCQLGFHQTCQVHSHQDLGYGALEFS